MFPFTLPLGGSLVILLILFFGEGKSQLIDDARQWIGERAGFSTITFCTYFAAFMVSRRGVERPAAGVSKSLYQHLLAEPALLLWMTSRHHVPLGPRLKWLAWNVAIGWGAIDEFFECSESPGRTCS